MVLRFAQKRKDVIEEKFFISVMSPVKHCEITARDELLSCPGNPLSMTDVHSITHRHDFQIGYPGEGGYFRNYWVGMCRWDPGTLNLYQS